jgi:uncharacterized YkwD family protein
VKIRSILSAIAIGVTLIIIPVNSASAAFSMSPFHKLNNLGTLRWYDVTSLFQWFETPKENSPTINETPELQNPDSKNNTEEKIKTRETAAPEAPAKNDLPGGLSADEQEMVKLVNEERTKLGIAPLQVDTELAKVARLKAQDMVNNKYFSHTSPTYGSPFDMMKKFGIRYSAAGENIARNGSVLKAHVSLMNSEGHRKNILNTNYSHIGIGIVRDQNGYVTICQMFIRK